MSAAGSHPVEPLLQLAQALARDRVDLGPLQRDLACLRDEIGRSVAVSTAIAPAEVTSTLVRALRESGLAALADRGADPRSLRADLERLRALVATIATTRGART